MEDDEKEEEEEEEEEEEPFVIALLVPRTYHISTSISILATDCTLHAQCAHQFYEAHPIIPNK